MRDLATSVVPCARANALCAAVIPSWDSALACPGRAAAVEESMLDMNAAAARVETLSASCLIVGGIPFPVYSAIVASGESGQFIDL